jgi:hypothetical protein
MPKSAILKQGKCYTFSQYFEMSYAPEDILAELGCTLVRSRLTLPQVAEVLAGYNFLTTYLERNLTLTNPISEISRREILIAPTLLEVCAATEASLKIEYSVNVSDWLRGNLDYYISAKNNLLVVEAKQADLAKGFTQLAVELIALDEWVTSSVQEQPILYGAVTTGEIWRLGTFDRQARRVDEDRTLYRVPEDLETLLKILVAILRSP